MELKNVVKAMLPRDQSDIVIKRNHMLPRDQSLSIRIIKNKIMIEVTL